MRCLYCGGGVPWRPLKWLIDDDFCSKSHRNSYHERFRKAISNLADLQIHPNDPLKRAEFLLQLPQLRKLVRPIYVRKGIIPEVATGLAQANEISTPPEQ